MNNIKKLLSGFIAGILSLSFIGCSGGENAGTQSNTPGSSSPGTTAGSSVPGTTTGSSVPGTTSTNDPQPTVPAAPVNVTISGVPLERYTIIYADHPYGKATRNLYTDYDFYNMIAESIVQEIAAQTGVTLQTGRDTKTDETDYEILVGPTNRTQSDLFDKMDVYNYTCKVDGSKLVVGGGYNSTKLTGNLKTSYCYAATYHAWDYVKAYISENAGETGNVDLGDSFLLEGTREITTVACIGDSITEGLLSTDWNVNSYPAALQRILWQDYLIINYGNAGKTMRDDLGYRYKGTDQYNAAKRYASTFDMALIMLGTNDSGAVSSWSSADDETFNRSALDIAKALTRSNEDLKLVIMNCPAFYGNWNSASPRVRWLQAGLVDIFNKAGYDTSFYNMWDYTDENLGPAHFPDQIHPDDWGYFKMAEGLAEMIPVHMAGQWVCEPTFPEDGKPAPALPDVEIPADSANLLSRDLEALYPVGNELYRSWQMSGAPFILKDTPKLSGSVVTNIEFPVNGCTKGGKFTVSVVKYSYPNLVETLSTHTLTVDFDGESGWLKFGGLNIEVPAGYTLAFGSPSDTIVPLYISIGVPGCDFYSVPEKSDNNTAAIMFNVYGRRTGANEGDDPEPTLPAEVPSDSVNLLSRDDLKTLYPVGHSLYRPWHMPGAPFILKNAPNLSGSVVTNIEIPIAGCTKGSKFTVSVVKYSYPNLVETLSTHTLTVDSDCSAGWLMFSGLNIEVPEGYTLAFGSPSDTIIPLYINTTVPGYGFYSVPDKSDNDIAAIAVCVYGRKK